MLHSAVKSYRGIALPLFTTMLPMGFPVATLHSELARRNIAVDRAAIVFFIRGSRFRTSTRSSAILVDFLDVLELFQENSRH